MNRTFVFVVYIQSLAFKQAKMDPTVLAASNMGLTGLQHEPRRLQQEADKCNAELESLVMENYRVFVENLTCSVQLRSEVRKKTNSTQS